MNSLKDVPELSAEYALVLAATLNVKTPAIPNIHGGGTGKDDTIDTEICSQEMKLLAAILSRNSY